MKTISHPFRIDGDGQVATVDQDSVSAAAQCAGHVLACAQGERPLAGPYGLPDPVGGIDVAVVESVLSTCEPELDVRGVTVTVGADGRAVVSARVAWGGFGE